MSTVFSKGKEKRSRSSSNEANNSFVKNVTSRVSGLLPSTITKWFSSPSTSNANGSAPAADATDSSTEDEAPESPITTQPPSKRMRLSSPGKYNHFTPTDVVSCVSGNIVNFEQCVPYNNSSVQSPPGRTTFRRETNYVSTPIRAPTIESPTDKSERDSTMLKSQHTLSNVGPSIATKRKSIFDTTNSEASKRACARTASNTMVDPKAPCFKPSLFGSPFYPGQTVYGGASSMYINQPNIKHRKVALVNESNSSDNTSMSYSARRVMDLLENYSTPLVEAKRISQYVRNFKNDSLNDSKTTSGSPYSPKQISYKTQELHVPNIASVLRLKQRSRLMDTTNAARQIIASHSSTSDCLPYPSMNTQRDQSEKETSGKFTTKVKSRLTRPKRGESDVESQMVTPVNLPTAVLQIDKDNMPKFSFGTTPLNNTSFSATSKFNFTPTPMSKPVLETKTKVGDTALSKLELPKPETITDIDSYKFSSPVRLSSEASLVASIPPEFTFSRPDHGVDKATVVEKKDDESSCVVGTPPVTQKLPILKTKDWKCSDCWVSNKTDISKCVCCGAKKPAEETKAPVKCSICKFADSQSHTNKCVNCEKVQVNSSSKLSQPTQNLEDSSKWKCEDCWVKNEENAEKCVCCGGKNPKKSMVTQKSAVANSIELTNSSNEWKCDVCWIKNKNNVDKCVACGGGKPGVKPTNTPALPASTNNFGTAVSGTTDAGLKNIVMSQSDKWECSSCLVRNESNRSKCVCCEADKPGTIKESAIKSFNFGLTPNTTFKFGIDPKLQEIKPSKPAEEKPAEVAKKPEESETNNNTLPKAPSFSFGIPAKKAQDQIEAIKTTNSESSKLNFTFGLPKTEAPTVPTVSSVFGSVNKITEPIPAKVAEEDEKLQEVPKVELTLPAPKESPKPVTSIFNTPSTTSNTNDKPLAPLPSLLTPSTTTEKKDSQSNALVQPTVTSANEKSAQNSFTFTGSALKPTVQLFAAPVSTATTFVAPVQAPVTTTVSLFQKPDTTTTVSISMFQKPDVVTTSTVSLFQKSDTTTSTAPPSLAATAPIFSFLNKTSATAAPQPEKPKFNFTFGSNSPMFNSSFGAPSTDSSTSTNKFGLTGNRLGTGGNGLASANTLAGGNGLTANKLGSTNELPTNPLPSRNETQPATGLFGAPVQKENLWSSPSTNSTNLFVSNASSTPLQKPATFTFGSSTPFNASTPTPAFGTNSIAPQPAQNVFGMNQSASNAAPLFSTPLQSQPAPSIFSSAQPTASPTPALGLFGANNVGAAPPAFGTPNPPVPSFETPSHTPAPAPAFNFGAAQPSGIFGFGQQPQQAQQAQPAGVYSFGAAAAPQVQFNMGSAPNTGMRRVRKAVRRNPQR